MNESNYYSINYYKQINIIIAKLIFLVNINFKIKSIK